MKKVVNLKSSTFEVNLLRINKYFKMKKVVNLKSSTFEVNLLRI